MKSLLTLGFAFFLPICLSASTVPSYQIAVANSASIHLTNDAVLLVTGVTWETSALWNIGDLVVLNHTGDSFLQPIIIENGLPVLKPLFLIQNSTQGTSVYGYLAEPPQLALLTIVAMDPVAGTVTLSDATVWNIREIDQRYFAVWNAGDMVFLGWNKGIDGQVFDAFLLNIDHSHVVHALEQ